MVDWKSSDTPFLGGPDTLEAKVVEHPFSFAGSDDRELNALVVEAVNRMGGSGEQAEDRYQRALAPLRERAGEVVDVVFAEYQAQPEESYLDRWSLVYLLSELRDPGAVQPLNRIITTRIPAEKAKESHDVSTVTEEVMIRTTAVEGLVRLSADGVEEARKVLLRHAKHQRLSIRRACVQGLMETGEDADRKELRALLKERGDEGLLRIKRIDVREAPQAIGGRFVVSPDVKREPPPHDLGREGED
jgi:HEAT repeat protein